MTTVEIQFDAGDAIQRQAAETLRQRLPGPCAVTLTPAGREAPAVATRGGGLPDVVVLLALSGLAALRGAGPHRPTVVALWERRFPEGLRDFLARRDEADGWIFSDPVYWEGTGRRPDTCAVASGCAAPAGALAAAALDLLGRVFADAARPAQKPDLSAELTVFVTTVGAPTFDACLAHLRAQDCTAALRVIDHVAPMNAAFQRMLDECRTPYYVQVDEDMLLYPHAVRTLHEAMQRAEPRVAMVMRDLYDPHLDRCIFGLKIYRHAIVRRYPYAAIDAFERQQVLAMEADGYRVLRRKPGLRPAYPHTLGLHGIQWTRESIFERYRKIERRRWTRPGEVRWFAPYPAQFLERVLADPSEENFLALMGVIAGRIGSRHGESLAKDYRTYASLPGFEALRRFWDEVDRSPD